MCKMLFVLRLLFTWHTLCALNLKHRGSKHLAKNQGNSSYSSWVLSRTTVEKHCYSCGNRETAEILRITLCLFLNAIHTLQQYRTCCDAFVRSSLAKSIHGASIKHCNHLTSNYCNSSNQSKPNTVNQVFGLYTPSVYPSVGVYVIDGTYCRRISIVHEKQSFYRVTDVLYIFIKNGTYTWNAVISCLSLMACKEYNVSHGIKNTREH